MKKQILTILVVAITCISHVSCKRNESKTEVTNTKAVTTSKKITTENKYTIDTATSAIKWIGSKPTGSHTGTLLLDSGAISTNEQAITSGNFIVNINSLTSTDLDGKAKESLESHLKGTVEGKQKDFFNVTEYPTAKFEITHTKQVDSKTIITGNLTIKDQTQPIEFPATVSFSENNLVLKSETFSIDRTLWGVNFMSKTVFDNLKDKFIDDEIKLSIEVHSKKM